jgi:hypothetical protein
VDKITQQKIKEAKQLLEQYAPKGEFLAYINEKEARILKAYGGAGKPIKQTNIPSYFLPAFMLGAGGVGLASWVLPAMIGISAGVSYMGSLNTAKNIRRSMQTDKVNATNRSLQLGIINSLAGKRKLSLQRALSGKSGTEPTGSNLLARLETIKEIELNEYFASKNLYTELSQLDARGTSLLAKEAFNRNTSLLNNIGSFAQTGNRSGLFGN